MPLSSDQIKKIVQDRRNQKEIQAGIHHQERLRFHVESVLNKYNLSPYYREFTDWIGNQDPEILAEDKFERFEKLLKTPIQTIELTESIFSRLYKIFFSQDSFFKYRFTDDSLEADWSEFRDDEFWRTEGFEAMQTAIDSVWIAAVPPEQSTEFPEPKNMLIDISNVISIKNTPKNECIYVIFQIGDVVYAYDSEFFRAYPLVGGKMSEVIEVPHDLGYTPARMFWSEKLESKNLINKESPITKELTDLDWLLFHQTSKKYLDLANAYPTIISYEAKGDYEDEAITDNEQRKVNKKPAGHWLMGAGSFITLPAPRDGETDMMVNPMKIISPDVETLEWHVNEETRLVNKIFKAVVGSDNEIKNDTAKNEMQIESSFESQESVLLRVKKNFEIINTFADVTLAKLRYGDRFIGAEIDYGHNFFLKDVGELQNELKQAKESGAGDAIVDSIHENILNTKYRNDAHSRSRAEIISNLDPLPNVTQPEANEILKNGGIDKINFIIKSNLISFVRRFERENTNIVQFGSLTNYNKKIEQIIDSFKEYAGEMILKPNENEII